MHKILVVLFLFPIFISAQADSWKRDEFLKNIDLQIPELLLDFNVPGAAICIIDKGEIIVQKGYGLANISKGTKVNPTTGFNIGSISKTITAWGIMKLVQDGKINLDYPAEKYLTRWQLPESKYDSKKVTIRRLLSHTAGLSLHGYPGWTPYDTLPTIEESLNGKNNGPGGVKIIMEPGTQWKYSGGGYTILQLIIEEVTGEKFEDFMESNILSVLGMRNSSFTINEEVLKKSSEEFDAYGNKIDFELFTAKAAAGFQTTIEDFSKFLLCNLNTKVLNESTVNLMTKPAPNSNESYGLGYQIMALDGTSVKLIGHSGANTGWHALFWINQDTKDGFIMFTNGGSGHSIYRQIFCDWVSWKYKAQMGNICTIKIPVSYKLKNHIDTKGIKNASKFYGKLKKSYADKLDFSERHLNTLGYTYLNEGKLEVAIAVFEINKDAFPKSFIAYDSYGEALLKNNQKEEAIASYKKSVELNPGNTHGIEVLKDLGINIETDTKEIDDVILKSYTGNYELAPNFILTISMEGKQLSAQATGQGKIKVFPKSEDFFYSKDIEAQIQFNTNKKGEIESLTLFQNGREMVAPKIK